MLWWPHGFKLLCCIYFNYYYIFKAQVALSLSSEVSWNWLLSFFDVTLEVRWLPCCWVYQHVLRLNVFYCWLTNYHIFQVLKMSVFVIKHLCSSKVHHCVVLCSESHKAEIKMLEELHYREIPGKNLTSGLFSFSKGLISYKTILK